MFERQLLSAFNVENHFCLFLLGILLCFLLKSGWWFGFGLICAVFFHPPIFFACCLVQVLFQTNLSLITCLRFLFLLCLCHLWCRQSFLISHKYVYSYTRTRMCVVVLCCKIVSSCCRKSFVVVVVVLLLFIYYFAKLSFNLLIRLVLLWWGTHKHL